VKAGHRRQDKNDAVCPSNQPLVSSVVSANQNQYLRLNDANNDVKESSFLKSAVKEM
jgi:hypothetical protein